MYRGRLWTMRQYAGFGTARESNQRYKYLLEQGQTGLSVAFDLPTQLGYDSDHPLSEGEVGKVGVAVDTLDDVRTLFDGIPLDKVSISMTINSTAPVLLAMLVAVARERGLDPAVLRGTVQNDVLKEYIARGTYIFPPGPSLNLTADLIRYCAANLPRFNPISISGYHIREAGSTAVQEVAFTLQDGVTYVQAALDRGLDIDAFAPRLSFFFAAHSNLFEEVEQQADRNCRRKSLRRTLLLLVSAEVSTSYFKCSLPLSGAGLFGVELHDELFINLECSIFLGWKLRHRPFHSLSVPDQPVGYVPTLSQPKTFKNRHNFSALLSD
jgi:methylmalonyl-CoA mutase cobalamin-binding domain/chain